MSADLDNTIIDILLRIEQKLDSIIQFDASVLQDVERMKEMRPEVARLINNFFYERRRTNTRKQAEATKPDHPGNRST